MKRKPIGSEWRILAWNKGGTRKVDLHSKDYERDVLPGTTVVDFPTVFDELVVKLGDDYLHLEQMDMRTWCLILGEEKRMLIVDRNGKLKIGEPYR